MQYTGTDRLGYKRGVCSTGTDRLGYRGAGEKIQIDWGTGMWGKYVDRLGYRRGGYSTGTGRLVGTAEVSL